MNNLFMIRWASVFGALAVILGALGAHALKTKLTPEQLVSFDTGVKYQMYHAFMLLILFLLNEKLNHNYLKYAAYTFIAGVFMFSGTIYLLSTRSLTGLDHISFLGPITPLGGIAFVAGWLLIFAAFIKKKA